MLYSVVKCPFTYAASYGQHMGTRRLQRGPTRERIAANLRDLMALRQWSEYDLARESGVAQKTINNILNNRTACNIETGDQLAAAFNLQEWQLMMPNLADTLRSSAGLGKLVEHWQSASDQGRELINLVAEREAAYKVSNDK